jgi:outer membrane protein OmpA-like peptidoglycan-associated protein
MRRFIVAVPIAALALGGSSACATKKFVRTRTGEVNAKVDALGRSLEQTQERTRRNENRIEDVDQKVQSVDWLAQAAGAEARVAASRARVADAKLDAIDKSSRRLNTDLILAEGEGNFAFGSAALPGAVKARIDELIRQATRDPKNIHIEIEGHTDSVGDPRVNDRIARVRAAAVQRYLYERYQIPLHKMNVISFGEEKPVATNATRTGRAQNRRVVLRIVA